MVVAAKTECGAQPLSTNLRRTVQSLKELTGNPSDTEVYAALKECYMDANEAAQKLLNQGLFHEVRRKRDKKKENVGFKEFSDHRKQPENANLRKLPENANHRKHSETENANHRKQFETENANQRKQHENANHREQPENANHTAKVYAPDRRFNDVRSSRFSRNNMHETVLPVSREFRVVRDNRVNPKLEKETKPAINAGPASGDHSSGANIFQTSAIGSSRNHKQSAHDYIPQHNNRTSDSQRRLDHQDINSKGHRKEEREEEMPAVPKHGHLPSSSLVEGVCASPSDPVHVPLSNSRSPAIKREVGVVGGHRQSVESSPKQKSSNSNVVQGSSSTTGSFSSINKKDQLGNSSNSSTQSTSNRAFLSQHHASRQYQPPVVAHHKGGMPSKEWRPKSSQMAKVSTAGMLVTPLKVQGPDPALLNEEISEVSIKQVQNVIIAQHIRAPENDCCQLTFGSFGLDTSSGDSPSVLQATGVHESATTSGSGQISDRTQLNLLDDDVRNNSSSCASDVATEQVQDEEQTTSCVHLESYSDTGLGRDSVPPLRASELLQHQNICDLPNFAAFDPQAGYDISCFRHVDDSASQNNTSLLGMVQQQQGLGGQMYPPPPQVHASHYANVMPYRHPVYMPAMGVVPGYSSNNPTSTTYAANGSSYVLMPGAPAAAAANIKCGVQRQQFKPFGSLEDSSRLKYKDSNNLYVSNAQPESSEVWIQNPRDHPGMQYYNMQQQQQQQGPAAYMRSHVSFNPAGVPQSSHMHFPPGGVYQPPPQMAPLTPYHHHLNWTPNF